MRRLILGTAGHIDHGKTALVRALTGIDTDRLPEEKRRGITIDLGFANLRLDDDLELALVDVPGHEAFVRNMLAGASGIDLVLLTVAADEGVMPQTREHLAIVELLGITRGIVAITKADLVDDDWLELVRDEVAELLGAGPLADAPVQVVSARSGQGIAELVDALRHAARSVQQRSSDDLFRMPIDRVFTVRGTGTVVTGTVWSGMLSREAQVRVEPAGLTARIRALQRHGAECEVIAAGERAAVALAGIDRHSLDRGDTLLDTTDWAPASILTVQLSVLRDAGAALRPRQRVRVHLGTAEVMARVALPAGEVAPGDRAIAQLRLERPLLARARDRLVIRSYSPVRTIAGGLVLEPDAPKRKRLPDATRAALEALIRAGRSRHGADDVSRSLDALLDLAGDDGVERRRLPVLTGLPAVTLDAALSGSAAFRLVGDRLVRAEAVERQRTLILQRVRRFHQERPIEDGIDRELLRRQAAAGAGLVFEAALQELLAEGLLTSVGGPVAAAGYEPAPAASEQLLLDRLRAVYHAAGVQAPELHELPPELAAAPELPSLIRLLERSGTLVRLGHSRWADAASVDAAISAMYRQMVTGEAFAVSDFRDVLNLSRKHLIPFLEYLDRHGVTARAGDARMLLPRPQPEAQHAQDAQGVAGSGSAVARDAARDAAARGGSGSAAARPAGSADALDAATTKS